MTFKIFKMTFKTVYRVHMQKEGKANGIKMAGGPGFEPRFSESESDVLPLNYPPAGPGAMAVEMTRRLCAGGP